MNPFPTASKRPHWITQHGQTRNDEYYWMRERADPEVIKFLQAENEYLDSALARLKPLRQQLFEEMRNRIQENDESVPEKNGDYLYYKRYESGKQYPLYCRKSDKPNAPEEILLDQNELAQGYEFCSVSAFAVSPDGKKLAYSVDLEGDEVYTIHVRDLATGATYPESISGVSGSVYFSFGVEWAEDSQTFFYVTLDEYHRACKLYRHTLGAPTQDDVLIFHETDDAFSVMVSKTRSDQFIMTHHSSATSQEMRFLPADQPKADLQIIQKREPKHEYYAVHHGASFLILTNHNAPNFKLVKAPIAKLGMENWQELLPQRADVLLEQIDVFQDFIVLHERRAGLHQLRLSGVDAQTDVKYISFPDPTYEVSVEANPEFETKRLRLKYSSLITPPSIMDYHFDTGELETLKEDKIPGGYERNQYAIEYRHAPAPDGKQIPISLVYKKGIKLDGNNPALLYGYGAYGASSEAPFNSNLLSLLNRGFVFAIGHIRGGAELGRAWYEDGKLQNKKNTFFDFIACAEYLIKAGFTSKEKLAISGGSAGGLLVGACMTMRPDLFKAIICKVPFLDVVTSMSDPTIPLTTMEYEEWGNPAANQTDFDYMLSYSPYDNLRPISYPHLLLTTGFNDPRVSYWEPAKFLARLRDLKIDDHLALLQTNFSAGHAGASGRYDLLEESALDFAFLIEQLNGN
ncbi:MAG: S9 family peptidase [Anaerolineales bacterium]|nr:S9 family peptidase [Anaerolineales bacterium]